MNHEESKMQIECVKWCDDYFAAFFPELMIELEDSKKRKYKVSPLVATPNERKQSIQAGVRSKRMGLRSGFPDLVLHVQMPSWDSLCIELKTKKGRMSNNQKSWMHYLNKNSAYEIVYSVDEFKEIVVGYLDSWKDFNSSK